MSPAAALRRPAARLPAVGARCLSSSTTTDSLVARAPHRLPTIKQKPLSFEENVALRNEHLPSSLRCHYENTVRPPCPEPPSVSFVNIDQLGSSPAAVARTQAAGPLKLKTGSGQFLYDDLGNQYLDCVNNVCHVGHCHPRVVQAAASQLGMRACISFSLHVRPSWVANDWVAVNTNSRYLHDNIVRLAKEVTAEMPDPLNIAFFVNSGTEATELALRLARNHAQRRLVYCIDGAYHGNSAAALAVSPYNKYSNLECSDNDSQKLLMPETYRSGLTEAEISAKAAAEYEAHLSTGGLPAAFIAESVMCCGGQVFLPEQYLQTMTAKTRACGGLTIADEVQTGFGRVGDHFWAFESLGVVPDIVTLGKPFGNGFPLSAVITSRAVAESSNVRQTPPELCYLSVCLPVRAQCTYA